MAGLGRVGLVGVVVVLVGAVLVIIHLAPVSLSSFLTYVSLFSRLMHLLTAERSVFTTRTSKGTLSLYTSTEPPVFTPETKNYINILFYFIVVLIPYRLKGTVA